LNQAGIGGAPAALLPVEAIEEFNLESQFGAEYGRNSGSVVNIVTRPGRITAWLSFRVPEEQRHGRA